MIGSAALVAGVAFGALVVAGALAGLDDLMRRMNPPEDPGSDADGRGGGNICPDVPPPRGGGGADPAWWPEFEREFAAYVAFMEDAHGQLPASPPDPACGPSRSPRRRTGARRTWRPRRRRERTDACVPKRPR